VPTHTHTHTLSASSAACQRAVRTRPRLSAWCISSVAFSLTFLLLAALPPALSAPPRLCARFLLMGVVVPAVAAVMRNGLDVVLFSLLSDRETTGKDDVESDEGRTGLKLVRDLLGELMARPAVVQWGVEAGGRPQPSRRAFSRHVQARVPLEATTPSSECTSDTKVTI
jgi:hypothetical protein